MLQAALADHPDCTVVLKVHPDVISGRARGHFKAEDLAHPRVRLSADGGHPARLLERARAVYVVTSQMGFEALLWGKPVHCFGMPFYGGWGADPRPMRGPDSGERQGASLEALVHAALVGACRCIDPHRHQPCSIESLMAAIGLQRRLQAPTAAAVRGLRLHPLETAQSAPLFGGQSGAVSRPLAADSSGR